MTPYYLVYYLEVLVLGDQLVVEEVADIVDDAGVEEKHLERVYWHVDYKGDRYEFVKAGVGLEYAF